MSMTIVHHVREKSQAKGSARTLLLNLAIYANDCCGVAWPSDATLAHDLNLSRQRLHELTTDLEATRQPVTRQASQRQAKGELVILDRPGATNLYCVAWQGKPLGGTSAEHPEAHDSRCPLRDPALWDRCAQRWPDRFPPVAGTGEGSEISDPSGEAQGSEISAGGSEISDGGSQSSLTQKQIKTREKNDAPAALLAHAPDKAEAASPFWCSDCGYSIPTCEHRVLEVARSTPTGAMLRSAPAKKEMRR
jgi:hypothetical protein